MGKTKTPLNLRDLAKGQPPGVTPIFGQMTAEAGSFVLEHNGHKSGVTLSVQTPKKRDFVLLWKRLHRDAVRSHNDLPEAAHYGAYGIAFLLTRELTDFQVIERSYKGPGFDYWLGSGDSLPFQRAARLEVSGIVNNSGAITARVQRKKKQTDRSAGKLPAYVAVVEFGSPKSVYEKR